MTTISSLKGLHVDRYNNQNFLNPSSLAHYDVNRVTTIYIFLFGKNMALNQFPQLTADPFRLGVLTPLMVVLGLSFSMEATAMGPLSQPAEPPGTHVPINNIILYSSGVGFFQHEGTIEGPTHVDFRFRTEAINDLLKSLVVQDGSGGSSATITYDSPMTPFRKLFKDSALISPGTHPLASYSINSAGNQ